PTAERKIEFPVLRSEYLQTDAVAIGAQNLAPIDKIGQRRNIDSRGARTFVRRQHKSPNADPGLPQRKSCIRFAGFGRLGGGDQGQGNATAESDGPACTPARSYS